MQREVQVTVVGKVFKPDRRKVFELNKCLYEYFKLVKWYLHFRSASKIFLRKNGYGEAKRMFNLNTGINIAQWLTRTLGWGSRDTTKPASEDESEKPQLNAGSSATLPRGSHILQGRGDVT